MKEYKDYMSRISGGAELKNRIMSKIVSYSPSNVRNEINYHPAEYDEYEEQVVQEQYEYESWDETTNAAPTKNRFHRDDNLPPAKRKRAFITAVAIVACAAGIVFGIFVMPGLLNRPAHILPEDDVAGSYVTESPAPEYPEYIVPPEHQGGELLFNFYEIVGYEWHDVTWDVHFNFELTDEQFNAVFPSMDIDLDWVSVMYDSDGNLVTIVAQESPAAWQDFNRPINVRTNINISRVEMPAHLVLLIPEDSPPPRVSNINGVEVTAIVYEGQDPTPQFDYSPPFDTADIKISFDMDGVLYRITITDDLVSGMHFAVELVNQLTAGGAADLSVFDAVVMPLWGDFDLTIEEARQDPTFGRYVPRVCPEGFELDWGMRIYTAHENNMRLHWRPIGLPYVSDHINLVIQKAADFPGITAVDINDRAAFDWSYHRVFIDSDWHDQLIGTPAWYSITNPVFRAEDLSLDVIRSRAYWRHPEVEYGWDIQRFGFRILDGDILIHVSCDLVGTSADVLWEMFRN